jgi:hypothetical protein
MKPCRVSWGSLAGVEDLPKRIEYPGVSPWRSYDLGLQAGYVEILVGLDGSLPKGALTRTEVFNPVH